MSEKKGNDMELERGEDEAGNSKGKRKKRKSRNGVFWCKACHSKFSCKDSAPKHLSQGCCKGIPRETHCYKCYKDFKTKWII